MEAIGEAGLLVEATEAAGGVDNLAFFEVFAGQGLIEVVKGLLDIFDINIAVQFAISAA